MNRATVSISMMNSDHLSEDQMYELLDQKSEAGDARVHLAACERCASEFAAVRESLEGFRVAATGLAEAKFFPILQVRRHAFSGMMAWPMGLAAAGVLVAASAMMVHHAGPTVPVHTASVQNAPRESDETLLDSVNQDLSASVPPSLEPLAVASADGAEMVAKKN